MQSHTAKSIRQLWNAVPTLVHTLIAVAFLLAVGAAHFWIAISTYVLIAIAKKLFHLDASQFVLNSTNPESWV